MQIGHFYLRLRFIPPIMYSRTYMIGSNLMFPIIISGLNGRLIRLFVYSPRTDRGKLAVIPNTRTLDQ
jgi:hypothetical protein